MSFLGNLFPSNNQSKSEKSPFERWGYPSPISEIPAGRLVLPSLPAVSQSISAALGPSIVIGLGVTGHAILRQWLEQTTHYESGSFVHVRVLSLLLENQPSFPLCATPVHQIVFGDTSSQKKNNSLDSFLQASNLRRFYDWLRSALLNMRDIQVLIVGSAADPEISLLGTILQILRAFPNTNTTPYSNIVALLSLSSSEKRQSISVGERYAVLREAGRFTFSGLHKIINLPNSNETAINSALLDHLFLFDENTLEGADDFNKGMGQALSEIVFFLNHPSSKSFWEALKNNSSGELRQRYHQPFVHTLGVKTFFVPLTEMQSYLAFRLAHAVLFGERYPQDAADQFIPPQKPSFADKVLVESLARRWLTDSGLGAHPIFEWLMTIAPSSQMALPDIHVDYHDLYSFKVSHSLVTFLNESNDEDKLKIAELVLTLHIQRFDYLLSAFENSSNSQSSHLGNLIYMLRRWRKSAQYLLNSLVQWQKTFSISFPGNLPIEANQNSLQNTTAMRIRLDWNTSQQATLPISTQSIYDLLQHGQKTAEEALTQITGGKVRFALTYSERAPLNEVEKYYEDTIRPELSHLGLPASVAFKSVRNRLEWWVRLSPSHDPELMFVCYPSHVNVTHGSLPANEYCYIYTDRQKIVDAVVALTVTQTSRYDDLTGDWYAKRLRMTAADVRGKTEDVFLLYDENISASFDADKRHYFLAAKNKVLTGEFLKEIFPFRISSEVTELDDYDPTRFTVLASRFSIPFSAIRSLNYWYDAYNHSPQFHMHVQEKNAAIYEDRIFRSQGRKVVFTPDFVLMLADIELITLFSQALFCKTVHLESDGTAYLPSWQVSPLAGFNVLNLGTNSTPNGLLEAFRKFVLEIPNDPNVKLNPLNHFHPSRRHTFLNSLFKEVRAIRNGENFKFLQSEFTKTFLADWQGRNDSLSLSFASLLQVELEEPVWEGWYL